MVLLYKKTMVWSCKWACGLPCSLQLVITQQSSRSQGILKISFTFIKLPKSCHFKFIEWFACLVRCIACGCYKTRRHTWPAGIEALYLQVCKWETNREQFTQYWPCWTDLLVWGTKWNKFIEGRNQSKARWKTEPKTPLCWTDLAKSTAQHMLVYSSC
jgi:hypothetical protein